MKRVEKIEESFERFLTPFSIEKNFKWLFKIHHDEADLFKGCEISESHVAE